MPAATDQRASEYSQLMAEVRQARLLDRSAVRYLPRLAVLSVMVVVGVTAFVWLGQSWWQMVVAAYFAVVFAQLGFLGHDAGHQQIFRSRRWNDLLGVLVSDLGIGLSYGWWVDKHTLHHRHPNEAGRDPDVKRNVLAWNASQADEQRGVLRFVARHQAAFFFPLLAFEALNLQVGSLRTLIAKPRGRGVEIALLIAHLVGCIALVLLVLSPVQAIAFVSVQQALMGLYLGSSFAPNHKGMPMPDENDAGLGFLRRQVLTSRNVRGGRGIATIFGGLNYQIEHHLFPSMPSRNLRRVQPMVKSFCAAHGVSYTETGLFDSYARALRYLRGVRPGVATQG